MSFVTVQKGGVRKRNRGRGSGGARWRLGWIDLDSQENSPEAPTFFYGLTNGVYSFIASVFSFLSIPVVFVLTTGRGFLVGTTSPILARARAEVVSPDGQSPSPHNGAYSFSTLITLKGTFCSSCWTSYRSPSPLLRFYDPTERAHSPEFLRDTSTQGLGATKIGPTSSHGGSSKWPSTPQEVYDLFQLTDVDSSFTATGLLMRLVGNGVLGKV